MPDVILPALNEAAAIEWVLRRMPPGFRAIVVDNGSTDATAAIAAAHGATVVSEPIRGFGSACAAGLAAATADVVCFMDCDASLDPAALPLLVGYVERNEFDLVLGSRVARRGRVADSRPHRQQGTRRQRATTHRSRRARSGPDACREANRFDATRHPGPPLRMAAGDGVASCVEWVEGERRPGRVLGTRGPLKGDGHPPRDDSSRR